MTAALCAAAFSLLPGLGEAQEPPAPPAPAPPFETVVTAPAPAARAPREDQAAAATVLLPEDSPRAYDDLASLLTEVPGVTVTRSGSLGTFATVALRGSNPDEVRVYLDGVPLNIAAGGAVDLSTLPLGDVERVEVYRGSTPLAFGESALGGIVSITTRTPGAARADARAGAGSFDTMFADASGGGRAGRLRLYAGAHGFVSRGAFGFRQDPGTSLNPADDSNMLRSDSDTRQADGVLRAALDLRGRRSLSLGAVAFARDQGLPGQQMFTAPTGARFRTARGLGYARYESSDDLGAGGRLAAQLFASAERDALDDPTGQVASTPTVTHDTTLSLGASAHARRPLLPWLGAAAMVEGRGETFRPVDDAQAAAAGVPARRLVGAAGAEIDLWLRPLNLDVIPSARVEAVQDVASDRGVSVTGMQPPAGPITRALPVLRLGLVRPLGAAVTVKANAGRYARIPSFLELYGMNGRLLGNPTLQPERGDNADLALWIDGAAAGGRVQLASRTTAFAARVQDLIGWEVTSWGQTRAENLSSTRVLGAEQELRLAAGRHARVVAQLTYTDARDEGPSTAHHGRQLPLHPRWHLYGRPELLRLPLGRQVDLGAFADADYTAGNHADGANLIALPRRLLIGAGLSVDLPRPGLRVTASGQNLLNSSVPDFMGWPLPGRSVFLALGWSSAAKSRSD